MTLSAGTRFGSYEILSPLGAGGMGEVYRARDSKLGRDVAIKVLPESLTNDADALARFEREAKAVAALSHPNILSIFDFGREGGTTYAVMELLEGETLRERLREGRLPPRKAVELAGQVARGLAAAHEKGIVHRDLKPENLFITTDGRLKILDFGLARQTSFAAGDDTKSPTVERATDPGTVLGTVGYMSPEQVRGRPADHRSDIFSFGCVLYEMLSGERAFKGESPVETMNAILKEEPRELSAATAAIPPELERIVRHCLEKSPSERFQSMRDVAFALEPAVSGSTTSARPLARLTLSRRPAVALLAALILGGGAFALGRWSGPAHEAPSFKRLTYRRGSVRSARFAPDGQNVVYGATWDGDPIRLFTARIGSPESSPLALPDADILSLSRSGEMLIALSHSAVEAFTYRGTLARVPLAGGAPREILEEIEWADWSPKGDRFAIARQSGGTSRLEYPPGHVLFETAGWISYPRVSPDGESVAFLEHDVRGVNGGSVTLVDTSGGLKRLSTDFEEIEGLAWCAKSGEIWFTGTRANETTELRAVSRSGRERTVLRSPTRIQIMDVAPDGRTLVTEGTTRLQIVGLLPGQSRERDFSWLDWSLMNSVSSDGRRIFFGESGEGTGGRAVVYVRDVAGPAPVRLGDGQLMAVSPDDKWVLAGDDKAPLQQLLVLPTGRGEPRVITRDRINHHWGSFLPDGKRVVFGGNEEGRRLRLWVQGLDGGTPRPISAEGTAFVNNVATPDSRFVLAKWADGHFSLVPVDGGQEQPVAGLAVGETVIGWAEAGRSVYAYKRWERPARIVRVDIRSGERSLFRELTPSDPAGLLAFPHVGLSADAATCVYTYARNLSDLFLVEGLK